MAHIYDRVALIGLGLIASSMAHAMRRAGVVGEITGYARSSDTRDVAREIGLCDRVCDSAAEACVGADLVVLCVPVGAMGAVAAEIAGALKPGATVSDVGSVKKAVIEAVAPHIPAGVHFVPAHPLAGTEHSGPRAGFAELFDNRWCLIVPQAGSDRAAVERLEAFWQALGSNTDEMDAEHHDLVLAVTSHAPHLIAYTMVGVADDLRRVTDSEVIRYSAAGFRDFTRIAASDPTMWHDIVLANRDAVLAGIDQFSCHLAELRSAIEQGDGAKIYTVFDQAKKARDEHFLGQYLNGQSAKKAE